MDSENQESTPEVSEAPASSPRKRAPRRVVSTDLPEKGADQASESKASTKSDDAENGAEKPATERPRRRRPAAAKSESSAAESESSDSSDDSEGSEDNGEGGGYGRGRGRGRGRDRRRGGGRGGFSEDGEPEISDDDVLIPIGGILDVLDNYAFVRTQRLGCFYRFLFFIQISENECLLTKHPIFSGIHLNGFTNPFFSSLQVSSAFSVINGSLIKISCFWCSFHCFFDTRHGLLICRYFQG